MRYLITIVLLFVVLLLTSCDISGLKWDLAKFVVVDTSSISEITDVSATCGGNITDDGGSVVYERGVCFNTSSNPTVEHNKIIIGNGNGGFSTKITGLSSNTTYYLKAYAINKVGISYGNEITFKTLGLPVISTSQISSITYSSAISGGTINSDGGATISARGICYGTTSGPTTSNSKISSGSGKGSFSTSLFGLTPGTTYYVRAYAINSVGTSYGNEINFKTVSLVLPTISTTKVTSILTTSAISGGTISNDGGSSVTARGICYSTTSGPTTSNSKLASGNGTGTFSISLSGLAPGTTYYIRAYAVNSVGTSYGNEVIAKTIATLPTINTNSATVNTYSSVISGGNITGDGGSTVTARGVCWSRIQNPTIADSKTIDGINSGSFSSTINGLSNNILYYFRSYATNSIGTAYGNQVSLTLYLNVPDASITDFDGNIYKTVKIGSQIWMAENLKVTKYRNGSTLSNITSSTTWASLTIGSWCDFGNSVANGNIYGHLYNFYSVVNSNNLCPVGWHVPTSTEWATLLTYLGGSNIAGAALKESGTLHWNSPNTSTNISGFSAFAGSWRGGDGNFYYAPKFSGYWWSSTSYDATYSYLFTIDSANNAKVVPSDPYFNKQAGCSIRCIKD